MEVREIHRLISFDSSKSSAYQCEQLVAREVLVNIDRSTVRAYQHRQWQEGGLPTFTGADTG